MVEMDDWKKYASETARDFHQQNEQLYSDMEILLRRIEALEVRVSNLERCSLGVIEHMTRCDS
jgi:hypothetical protein